MYRERADDVRSWIFNTKIYCSYICIVVQLHTSSGTLTERFKTDKPCLTLRVHSWKTFYQIHLKISVNDPERPKRKCPVLHYIYTFKTICALLVISAATRSLTYIVKK